MSEMGMVRVIEDEGWDIEDGGGVGAVVEMGVGIYGFCTGGFGEVD
jgi:hypothetical protein